MSEASETRVTSKWPINVNSSLIRSGTLTVSGRFASLHRSTSFCQNQPFATDRPQLAPNFWNRPDCGQFRADCPKSGSGSASLEARIVAGNANCMIHADSLISSLLLSSQPSRLTSFGLVE
jgi:hypothetical protein